jgi:alpha-galactosidase
MRIKSLLLIVGLLLPLLPEWRQARAANVVFTFQSSDSTVQAARGFCLYPIGGPFTNAAGAIITRDRVCVTTGTNGSVTISNVYGWTYRSELQGTYAVTTNYYTFPVTNGTISADLYTGSPTNGPALAYSAITSDLRFLQSTNTGTAGQIFNWLSSSNIGFWADSVGSSNSTFTANVFQGGQFIGNGTIDTSLSDYSVPYTFPGLRKLTSIVAGASGTLLVSQGAAAAPAWTNKIQATLLSGLVPSSNVATGTYAFASPFITTNGGSGMGLDYNAGVFTNLNATNLSGIVQPANLLSADFTNSGSLGTNGYGIVTASPHSSARILRKPLMGIQTFYGNNFGGGGAEANEANLRLYVDRAFTNGLVDLGWQYIVIDEGWALGRSNNTILPDPAKWTNIASAITYAHSKGLKVGLYTEPAATTEDGINTGSPPQYFANDCAQFAAWGVDYIKLDIQGGLSTERLNVARQFADALRTATAGSNRPIVLHVGGVREGQINYRPLEYAQAFDLVRLVSDFGSVGGDIYRQWVDYLTNYVDVWDRQSYVTGAGLFMDGDHQLLLGGLDAYTNATYGTFTMSAMLDVTLMPAIWSNPDDPFRFSVLTNRDLIRVSQDPLVIPATRTVSNATYQVWVKPLSDGSKAIALLNPATNAAASVQLFWTNAGFASNQRLGLYDCWTHQTLTNSASGSYTYSVPLCGAALLIVYQTNSPAPLATTNSYGSVWPLIERYQVNQLFFDGAPGGVGNANQGPSPMFIENAAWSAANTDIKWYLFPPTWSTNAEIRYGVQSDQAISYWTNTITEFQWDVQGARNFSAALSFPCNGTNAAINRFTNNVPLSSHHPMALRIDMLPGTNVTGSRYLVGIPDVEVIWK